MKTKTSKVMQNLSPQLETKSDLINLDPLPTLITPETIQTCLAPLLNTDINELSQEFSKYLTFESDPTTCLRSAISRDLMLVMYWQATQYKFNYEQISVVLGIVNELLLRMASMDEETSDSLLEYLQDKVRGVNVDGYIGGPNLLDEQQWEQLIGWLDVTIFQHYTLYKYVMTEKQEDITMCHKIKLEELPKIESLKIAPLEEALPVSFHDTYINPQEPTADTTDDNVEGYILEDKTNLEEIDSNFDSSEIQKVLKYSSDKAIKNLKDDLMTQLINKETDQQARIKKLENKLKQIK